MSQDPSSRGGSNNEPTGAATTARDPAADVLFGVLARATNRFVLDYLVDSERQVSVNELVEYVVTVTDPEPGETVGELRGSVRASVERSVTELESEGFLHHNPATKTVEATNCVETARPHLDLVRERFIGPDA